VKNKDNIIEVFRSFLKKVKVYDSFVKEIEASYGVTFEGLFDLKFINTKFPGYFITEAFTWARSVTQKPKAAYEIWNTIHWRWMDYIKENGVADLSEWHQRSW